MVRHTELYVQSMTSEYRKYDRNFLKLRFDYILILGNVADERVIIFLVTLQFSRLYYYLRQVNEVNGGDNAFVRCVFVCQCVCVSAAAGHGS